MYYEGMGLKGVSGLGRNSVGDPDLAACKTGDIDFKAYRIKIKL